MLVVEIGFDVFVEIYDEEELVCVVVVGVDLVGVN